MKVSNLTWDAATLDAYLTGPQKVVPGNKTPFPGLKTKRERSAVIAFLAPIPRQAARPRQRHLRGPRPLHRSRQRAGSDARSDCVNNTVRSAQAGANSVPGLRYTLRSGIAD